MWKTKLNSKTFDTFVCKDLSKLSFSLIRCLTSSFCLSYVFLWRQNWIEISNARSLNATRRDEWKSQDLSLYGMTTVHSKASRKLREVDDNICRNSGTILQHVKSNRQIIIQGMKHQIIANNKPIFNSLVTISGSVVYSYIQYFSHKKTMTHLHDLSWNEKREYNFCNMVP